jgi:hypothetical protein
MQKLILCFVSLSLAFPAWTTGIRPLNLEIASDNEMPIPDNSFPASSTTSGWTDLHLDDLRDEPGGPTDYLAASSSAQADLTLLIFDRPTPTPGPPEIPPPADNVNAMIGVIAASILVGALRLLFTSPAFRKVLWNTFSPLSPLGY